MNSSGFQNVIKLDTSLQNHLIDKQILQQQFLNSKKQNKSHINDQKLVEELLFEEREQFNTKNSYQVQQVVSQIQNDFKDNQKHLKAGFKSNIKPSSQYKDNGLVPSQRKKSAKDAVPQQNYNKTVKVPVQYLSTQLGHMIPSANAKFSGGGGEGQLGGQVQNHKLSIRKRDDEYSKTIEQMCSPNSSTLNLEHMKKTQSLHYMKANSGASSPQQIKSRSSMGHYANRLGNSNNLYSSEQRQSFQNKQGARAKTANRKKRNLYTSMGNYYSGAFQNQANMQNSASQNPSAARSGIKRLNNNFLDNLEKSNYTSNYPNLEPNKKRNSQHNKTQFKNDMLDLSVQGITRYNNNVMTSNPQVNKSALLDNSQLNTSHAPSNNTFKNLENSFQFNGLSNSKCSGVPQSSKVRAQSSAKPSRTQAKKKTQTLRKSGNSNYNISGGNPAANAFEYLINANIAMVNGKKSKIKGSNLDSRCSNKNEPSVSNSVLKQTPQSGWFPQMQETGDGSRPHHGKGSHQLNNNTSSTTICSNRRVEQAILSGKKNSYQHYVQQPIAYLSHEGMGNLGGEISSDRQTLRMNDILKHMEAYNEQHIAPTNVSNQNQMILQVKMAEKVLKELNREDNYVKSPFKNDELSNAHDSPSNSTSPIAENLKPYEDQLTLLRKCMTEMSSTMHPQIQHALQQIQQSYENVIQSLYENFSSQVEDIQCEMEKQYDQVSQLEAQNEDLNQKLLDTEVHFQQRNQQINQQAKKNSSLESELQKIQHQKEVLEERYEDQQEIIEVLKQKLAKSEKGELSQAKKKIRIPALDLSRLQMDAPQPSDQQEGLSAQNEDYFPGEQELEGEEEEEEYEEEEGEEGQKAREDIYSGKYQYQIPQDKSPLQKPFIPLLNLNVLDESGTSPAEQNVMMPKLNLGKVLKKEEKVEDYQPQENNNKKKTGMGLDLSKMNKKADFQDEFMEHFDEFSESWRDAAMRMKQL